MHWVCKGLHFFIVLQENMHRINCLSIYISGGYTQVLTEDYQENGEWKLTNTSVQIRSYGVGKTVKFPYVRFVMVLRFQVRYESAIYTKRYKRQILQLISFVVHIN